MSPALSALKLVWFWSLFPFTLSLLPVFSCHIPCSRTAVVPLSHIRAFPQLLFPRADKRRKVSFLLSPQPFSLPVCTHGEIKDCPGSLGSCSCTSQATLAKRHSRWPLPGPGECLSLVGTLLWFFISSFITQVEIAADYGKQNGAENA